MYQMWKRDTLVQSEESPSGIRGEEHTSEASKDLRGPNVNTLAREYLKTSDILYVGV
jgi:hypothetical protein